MYSNDLNYNDLVEVDDSLESKQGVMVIEDHFAPGFSSPATLVLQSEAVKQSKIIAIIG